MPGYSEGGWWIQDLAAPDPWYILPVVMAVSMFVQTKLNPTPPDPIQAQVMMFIGTPMRAKSPKR